MNKGTLVDVVFMLVNRDISTPVTVGMEIFQTYEKNVQALPIGKRHSFYRDVAGLFGIIPRHLDVFEETFWRWPE